MTAIILDQYIDRFRSEADFDDFVSMLATSEMKPIWARKRHLATLVSPATAKTLVQDRMVKRLSEDPRILDEVKDRLENDEIVD